ncbi:MAG: hypothetical protein RMK91_08575 [Pseudanabaenaceae cyanobacterium SKYGB_i_bin29]|nr:hypothetical protein [Pseudanabaenaceae cyanobacterium SKYG29]MDW8421909.1 hypothetical protein [Pseudanabaenaceae cyanobacterium SKYGB_i_bin29]
MTDQPMASAEVTEQLNALSDSLASEIAKITEMLQQAQALLQSAQAAEAAVAQARQEMMAGLALADRVQTVEGRLEELLGSLPRLAQDVKNFARLAQHMDQCANEVNQWYTALQQKQVGDQGSSLSELQGHILELHNALQAYSQSHQALAEQVALLQSQPSPTASGDPTALDAKLKELEQKIAQLESSTVTPISDETQLQALVERVMTERLQTLQGEMGTMQQDWQTGAAILQQMQVRIEALESRSGDATTAQLEAIRSEMQNMVNRAKAEQEASLHHHRSELEKLSKQGNLSALGVLLGGMALIISLFAVSRR